MLCPMATVGFGRPKSDLVTDTVTCRGEAALSPPSELAPWQIRRCRRSMALPAEPRAALGARHAVKFACALWSATNLYDTAASCVTELVTNAVQHTAWPQDPSLRVVWLTVSVAGPYLLVEVSDPDSRMPIAGAHVDWDRFDWTATIADDGRGESGFGLSMVVELVREAHGEFGAVLTATGKTVFFALPLSTWLPTDANGAENVPAHWKAEV